MAVIFGVLDSDLCRRRELQEMLPESLSGLPYVINGKSSFKDLDIYWEASRTTPISAESDCRHGDGRFAFVVGDYDEPYSLKSDAAIRLLNRTAKSSPDLSCISGQDGYYLAIQYDSVRIALGTDCLGLFPLYYWSCEEVFIFGTSPSLFKMHPLFSAQPDYYGIVSKLLISHISGGRTLYKGVFRNKPGYYVVWGKGNGASEKEGNSLQLTDENFDLSIYEARDCIADSLDSFHSSLLKLPALSVSLSGGLDSRLIVGYVDKYLSCEKVKAVSLGNKNDSELRYARRTSRVVDWNHLCADEEPKKAVGNAHQQIQLESLQGPFASFAIHTQRDLLAANECLFISGYFGDHALGDGKIYSAFSHKSGLFEFDLLFKNINKYGFEIEEITELMSCEKGKNFVYEVLEDLKQTWENIKGLPFQKAWYFGLTHRQRFHIGSLVWRLSLGAWPLLPYISRPLLNTAASMPLSYFNDRRIQVDIIKTNFPRLALIPIDTNSKKPSYLIKPLHVQLLDCLPPLSSVSWKLHRLVQLRKETREKNKIESRYYFRVYDFNSPSWKNIRKEADIYRDRVGDILNLDGVNYFLPSANEDLIVNDKIVDSLKIKTVLSLVLWNASNKF